MNVTLGFLIRNYREDKNLTRPQLAKRLSISPAYLGHLENDVAMPLSPRLFDLFNNKLGLYLPRKLVESHNVKAKRIHKKNQSKHQEL